MYVTAFDSSYLSRGIVMIDSFMRCNPNRRIKVWCIDKDSYSAVLRWKEAKQVDFECEDLSELRDETVAFLRATRDYREFCWSLSSFLTNYELTQGAPEVTYLDADLYFTDAISDIELEISNSSIAAVGHRFPKEFERFRVNGIFNVQWVTFKNDEDGQKCSQQWLEDCIKSTEYDPENGIVGDQKYLDKWPNKYKSFREIENPGAGVGPWNITSHRCEQTKNKWIVNKNEPLIFYHFQGLRVGKMGWIVPCGSVFMNKKSFPRALYREYILELAQIEQYFSGDRRARRLFLLSRTGVVISEIIVKLKKSKRGRN